MRIACATDDGKKFSDEHFGSASYYLIYEYKEQEKEFVKIDKIMNTSGEERGHGDAGKAERVMKLMKDGNVDALMGEKMGRNIIHIKKGFVPIISRIKNIEEAMAKLDVEMVRKILANKEEGEYKIVYVK
ncbi:MAG: dinitrogenase iron-molybdenum cofactor biosynthesis protein [Thermoplasmata archaeon]|nr:dinitrogenase iron-molybdenum cofactor biosynthesis protein [Thermoplasmata archaeon]